MNEFHPRVISKLLDQLPMGSAITRVDTSHPTETLLTINTNGVRRQGKVEKTQLPVFLNAREVELLVEEGTELTAVLDTLSTQHGLFWVKGVDYADSDHLVVYDDSGVVYHSVVVPQSSPLWFGAVGLKLLNPAVHALPTETLTPDISGCRIQMALTSTIFDGEGKVFTKDKKRITANFARKIYNHLRALGITTLGPDQIGEAKLVDVVIDNFSGMIVSQPKDGPTLFIRFRSGGEDLKPLPPLP